MTEQRGPGWFGLYRDAEQGIRIDRELERAPGVPFARVLIAFRDKALADERVALKAEGFRFDDRVEAWGKEASAANVLLAKRLVNRFLKDRGVGSQLYV
ncbi:MAG TPA: hypothetical protein VD866_19515 [Urbifossiella sp.]|nr:hypothetical protein [Urbifossiella sp.]